MKAPIADHGGRCLHGAGTAFGGCQCKRYRARGKGAAGVCTCTHAETMHAPVFELAAALERVGRGFDALRDAVLAALAIREPTAGELSLDSARSAMETLFDVDGSAVLEASKPKKNGHTTPATSPAADPRAGRFLEGLATAVAAAGDLSLCSRKMLEVLAHRDPKPTSAAQLGILTGYTSAKNARGASTFRGGMGALQTRGLATGGRAGYYITGKGKALAGQVPPPPTGAELLDRARKDLPLASVAMLEVFVEYGSRDVSRQVLEERTGYEGSTFRGGVGRLRTLGLVEGWHLAPELLEALGR